MRRRTFGALGLALALALVPGLASAQEVTWNGQTYTTPEGDEWNVSDVSLTQDEAFAVSWNHSVEGTGVSTNLYRLYNPYTGEHLYTTDANECDELQTVGWSYEDWSGATVLNVYEADATNVPEPAEFFPVVYRLYNPYVPGGDHHYTTSRAEYDALCEVGWSGEGALFYSGPLVGRPAYRLYNPYATTGAHHYTDNPNEVEALVEAGWVDEGVGWFFAGGRGQ